MKRLVIGALSLGMLLQPASGQDGGVGEAPDFLPLQDHTTLDTGQGVFKYWCWNCHGEGPGKPGTDALQTRYQGDPPAVLEQREDLDPDVVRYFVRNGTSIMPFFRKTQISDAQLDLLANYLAGIGE